MEFYSMDELPKAVKSGKLSKKQAGRLIWEEVYTHPAEYGLFYFTEDQKSDFLLSIQETFEKLFEKFMPGMISFKTFITGCITNQKNAFLRNQIRREHERRSIDTYLRTKTEEDSEKYEVKLAESPQFDFSHDNSKDFSDVIEQEINSQEKKDKRVAELTALVLMMKACKDVDDETVTAVSNFTEVDKSLLYEKLQELKQTLSEKSDSFTTLVKRRNNAFYFHRKYMQEIHIQCFCVGSECRYEHHIIRIKSQDAYNNDKEVQKALQQRAFYRSAPDLYSGQDHYEKAQQKQPQHPGCVYVQLAQR